MWFMSIKSKSEMCDSPVWSRLVKMFYKNMVLKMFHFKQMLDKNQLEILFLMEFISLLTPYKIRNHKRL